MGKFNFLICVMIMFLSGCAVNQGILIDYKPEAYAKIVSNHIISVKVTDERSFVKDGTKPPFYIGHFRAGFGNTWSSYTVGRIPLAQQFADDIIEEIKALGLQVKDAGGDRTIKVEILDYNFDAYVNGKFWYEIKITVSDQDNKILSESIFKDTHVIKGSVWIGPMSNFKKRIPEIHQELVKKMIRDNPEVIDELK